MLLSSLPKNSQSCLKDYYEATVIRNNAVVERAYKSGFCTATQLIFAGLSESERRKRGVVMDIMELHQALSALLDKLKRNRELVSLSELKTKYRKPYTALCEGHMRGNHRLCQQGGYAGNPYPKGVF